MFWLTRIIRIMEHIPTVMEWIPITIVYMR